MTFMELKGFAQSLAAAAAFVASTSAASATGISDNFEGYAVGSFPSAQWQDVGAFMPEAPIAPVPSGSIIKTTDAFGNPTQAFQTTGALSSSAGIYDPVPVSATYSLQADIRVDQFSDHPGGSAQDWPMELTLTKRDANFAGATSGGVYVSSLTKGWRLFVLDNVNNLPTVDIDLGIAATLGTWYGVSLTIDATNGVFHSIITDAATGFVLSNQINTIIGWKPSSGAYDSVAFFKGDGTPSDTIGDIAAVDNVNVTATPEPASLMLFGAGALGLLRARRQRD